MSSIFVKHFELPCVERCYINKLALPCLALPCLTNTPPSIFTVGFFPFKTTQPFA